MATTVAQDAGRGVPSLADKLRFLRAPTAYPRRPATVEIVETHMSYVFMAGDRAYKLKKPVLYPYLDFSTIEKRERNCREEARLNRRLAPDVYLDVVPLTAADGSLTIGGAGEIVDWLLEMRRLPQEKMLDCMIATGGVDDAQLRALCDALAAFYRNVDRTTLSPSDYAARFEAEQKLNREILTRVDCPLRARASLLLDRLDARLAVLRTRLEARVTAGRVVDGHGDLRPEHICLSEPVVIFDCLEFNASLRQVEPFDEVALLGVECAQLGAPQLLRPLVETLAARLDCAPPWELVVFYGAWRAALRARLSYAHLLEPSPRQAEKWTPLAARYLDIAEKLLDGRY